MHKYMRLAVTSEDQHNGDYSSLSGTPVVFAGLDAIIATAVESLKKGAKNSIGGH